MEYMSGGKDMLEEKRFSHPPPPIKHRHGRTRPPHQLAQGSLLTLSVD
jgi:hypothetical protein